MMFYRYACLRAIGITMGGDKRQKEVLTIK